MGDNLGFSTVLPRFPFHSPFIYRSIYLSIYLSICLSIYLSIYLSLCSLSFSMAREGTGQWEEEGVENGARKQRGRRREGIGLGGGGYGGCGGGDGAGTPPDRGHLGRCHGGFILLAIFLPILSLPMFFVVSPSFFISVRLDHPTNMASLNLSNLYSRPVCPLFYRSGVSSASRGLSYLSTHLSIYLPTYLAIDLSL